MKVYVAGHYGMVGSAVVRAIESEATMTWVGATRGEVDLLSRQSVFDFVSHEKPDAIVIAAAKVGGIVANRDKPVEFLTENIQIESNLIDAAHRYDIGKVIFLGSSCVYPKNASQPIKEEDLLTGALEETNESYAIAKIAGIKLIDAYRKEYGRDWTSLMPTNLYGPKDNFDPITSHVIPGLITKFHGALVSKSDEVELWGTGSPMREFLHVEDLALAIMKLLEINHAPAVLNVGSGEEVSISELASLIARVTGFEGQIRWNKAMPDGTPRKLLDSQKIYELGWKPTIPLEAGIIQTYDEFVKSLPPLKG
jgi:GDP-L-fucose synthase